MFVIYRSFIRYLFMDNARRNADILAANKHVYEVLIVGVHVFFIARKFRRSIKVVRF